MGHALTQVSGVNPRQYRMTRRLSPAGLQQMKELYRRGISTYQPARQFDTDRHTITRHLRLGGVELRPRQKLTPQFAEEAARLYTDGHSLAAIGNRVGLTPTAVGNALKRAGMKLRDTPDRPTLASQPFPSSHASPSARRPWGTIRMSGSGRTSP